MSGCSEDVDGLVGRGEALLSKEEYQEAIRVFEKAFEASGRSDRDVSNDMERVRIQTLTLVPDPPTDAEGPEAAQAEQAEGLLQDFGCSPRCRRPYD